MNVGCRRRAEAGAVDLATTCTRRRKSMSLEVEDTPWHPSLGRREVEGKQRKEVELQVYTHRGQYVKKA